MTRWKLSLGVARGRWWKALGLAGLVGVAAGGAAVARAERSRRAYTPDEVRARLVTRYAEAASGSASGSAVEVVDETAGEAAADGTTAEAGRDREGGNGS
ncbi:hypothetical protein Ga0074812_14131 [Parafrankia irregularis]|uniref:Uncharacterized protein n=1 Tax=Parafrankia irregularis TaxID=795642 RepID=A0A0S4QY04_9ACTN|nr:MULTISPECIES: hypothetical protein [Parafrankia]CUU60512.1 hypothetical protein Ga0074812_14131 [Parafrankia irregularis]